MSDKINRSIINHFARIGRFLKRHVAEEPGGRFAELTLLQLQALMYLKHHEQAKMNELATALGASASSASLLVDRLVAAKLVVRHGDTTDRRVVSLKLTPSLQQHFERSFNTRLEALDQILDRLPASDRRELDRILKTLEELL